MYRTVDSRMCCTLISSLCDEQMDFRREILPGNPSVLLDTGMVGMFCWLLVRRMCYFGILEEHRTGCLAGIFQQIGLVGDVRSGDDTCHLLRLVEMEMAHT